MIQDENGATSWLDLGIVLVVRRSKVFRCFLYDNVRHLAATPKSQPMKGRLLQNWVLPSMQGTRAYSFMSFGLLIFITILLELIEVITNPLTKIRVPTSGRRSCL